MKSVLLLAFKREEDRHLENVRLLGKLQDKPKKKKKWTVGIIESRSYNVRDNQKKGGYEK